MKQRTWRRRDQQSYAPLLPERCSPGPRTVCFTFSAFTDSPSDRELACAILGVYSVLSVGQPGIVLKTGFCD